jgi:hypothetical protein
MLLAKNTAYMVLVIILKIHCFIANTITDNIDMIGRRDEAHAGSNNYVYVIGADRLSTDLDAICTTANATTLN